MRADARANRRDLVAAATRLLAEQGAGMSLRGVAQAAGVGVGTLYRHFPTRRDLVLAVMEECLAGFAAIFARFLEAPAGDPEALAAAWRRLAEDLGREDLVSLALAKEGLDPEDAPPPELLEEAERRMFRLADDAVARARAAGLAADGVTGERHLAGVLVVTRPLPPPMAERSDAERSWLLDVYLDGLRPRG